MKPASASGHCRVTVVAPNTRVDVALPEDVPLAELLPEVVRLLGDHSGTSSLVGQVLTASGGRVLDTSLSLNAQGVRHGELLRLCSVDDIPEAPVHDDIVDAVAEAVLAGGRMWTATALRVASLTAVAGALGVGAVALWFSASRAPGSFHGQAAILATGMAISLFGGGIWRARYALPARGRASYYVSPATSLPEVGGPGRGVVGDASHPAEDRDYGAAVVLTTCALPYAFIAGFGLLPTGPANGLGRAEFTTGCAVLLIAALAAMLGLGRRIPAAVAGAVIGLAGTVAGVGMLASKCAPSSAVAVVAACCALAVETLPYLAMYAARFIIEAPSMGLEPGDFDGSPVDVGVVALRVERTREMLAGLVAGVSVLIVLCCALLVVPVPAFGTATRGGHHAWAQVLAGVVATAALCRARLFRERGPVVALVAGGLSGLAVVALAVAATASPAARGSWLLAASSTAALIGLALSTLRARRGATAAVLPPQWGRIVDAVEGALMLGVLPVMLAVLGVYGKARGIRS
jgi:hypothetical protein